MQNAGSWEVTQESTSGGGSRSYVAADMPPEVLEMLKPWRRARDVI